MIYESTYTEGDSSITMGVKSASVKLSSDEWDAPNCIWSATYAIHIELTLVIKHQGISKELETKIYTFSQYGVDYAYRSLISWRNLTQNDPAIQWAHNVLQTEAVRLEDRNKRYLTGEREYEKGVVHKGIPTNLLAVQSPDVLGLYPFLRGLRKKLEIQKTLIL